LFCDRLTDTTVLINPPQHEANGLQSDGSRKMSTPFHRVPHPILPFHQLAQHYKALIITTIAMAQQQSSMMGDHSNEETEYATNSVVDDRDDILVPSTLPPLPTEEEQDIWRGFDNIYFTFFLGDAYFSPWPLWLHQGQI
jgi:hypothetical protein